jgi:hypothetical protein
MMCDPLIDMGTEVGGGGSAEVSAPWLPARRDGDLEERLAALRDAASEASGLREVAASRLHPHLEIIAARLSVLAQELSSWPDVLVEVHSGITAVGSCSWCPQTEPGRTVSAPRWRSRPSARA